jgi:hypothetical protein
VPRTSEPGKCGARALNAGQKPLPCSRIEALTGRIRALPATTFQGLVVKALHLTFDASSLWMKTQTIWTGISTAFASLRRKCCGICRMTYSAGA